MSNFETAQRRRNIIVGAFVVFAIAALFWIIIKFGDLPTVISKFGSYPVHVQFPTAPGVQKDTPVRFCGYQVGKVIAVMAPRRRPDLVTGQEYHHTVVTLSIDEQFHDIPSNVDVKLMSRGLGSSYIELKLDPTKPLKAIDPNSQISKFLHRDILLQGSTGVTSEFFPEESMKKFEQLVDNFSDLLASANAIIGDVNNQQNIGVTLANLTDASREATATLQKAADTIDKFGAFADTGTTTAKSAAETLDKFGELAETGTSTMKSADARINEVVASFLDTSGELGKTAAEMRAVLQKVNNGDGSAGRFLNDGKLYESIIENSRQIEMLLTELRAFTTQAREKGIPLKLK